VATKTIQASITEDLSELLKEYKDTTFWAGFFAGAGMTCLACLIALGLIW
jgi:hypothetical protein